MMGKSRIDQLLVGKCGPDIVQFGGETRKNAPILLIENETALEGCGRLVFEYIIKKVTSLGHVKDAILVALGIEQSALMVMVLKNSKDGDHAQDYATAQGDDIDFHVLTLQGLTSDECSKGEVDSLCSYAFIPTLHSVLSSVEALASSKHGSAETQGDAIDEPAISPVIIDSLSALLCHHTLAEVCEFLTRLRQISGISPIIGIFDKDAFDTSTLIEIQDISQVLISVDNSTSLAVASDSIRRDKLPASVDGRCRILRKARTGKVNEITELFIVEESTLKLVTPEELEKLESQSLEDEAKDTPEVGEVSFNLSLSAQERKEKGEVVLPYERRQRPEQERILEPAGTDQSLVYMEEDDPDYEGDDLDDDLDI